MGYILLNIISHTCSFFYATGGLRQKNQKIFIKFMTRAVSPCLEFKGIYSGLIILYIMTRAVSPCLEFKGIYSGLIILYINL